MAERAASASWPVAARVEISSSSDRGLRAGVERFGAGAGFLPRRFTAAVADALVVGLCILQQCSLSGRRGQWIPGAAPYPGPLPWVQGRGRKTDYGFSTILMQPSCFLLKMS